jgi:hypothetical protein
MSSRKYSQKLGRMLMMVENRPPLNVYVFRLTSKPINASGTTKASELVKICEAMHKRGKVKARLSMPRMHKRGSKGTAPLILTRGARLWRVVRFIFWPLYSGRKKPAVSRLST